MNRISKRNLNTPYNIGLDIGVASVGWSVTGMDYKLLKTGNSKNLWGYNIFEKAETAKARRVYRSARRRYTKRKQRIKLLQDLCSEMIYEIDKNFFKKLQYSYLVPEDKLEHSYLKEKGYLFDDVDFNDKKYYEKYPTIYHLRDHLVSSTEKEDPRLIYLALHHIVKYRGNFLYEGQTFSSISNSDKVKESLAMLFEYLRQTDRLTSNEFTVDNYLNVLIDNNKSKKDKVKDSQELTSIATEKKIIKEISNAICGYKFNLSTIFDLEEEKKYSFKDEDFESEKDEIYTILNEESDYFDIIEKTYNYIVLKDILGENNESISKSMISIYESHKNDLLLLKKIAKQNPKVKEIIKKNGLYEKYINCLKVAKKDKKVLSKDLLYKEILDAINDDKSNNALIIKERIENERFLQKQNTTDNGAIPYQLHYNELNQILENQSRFYKCLDKNKDKIKSLVSFRTPYYLGPYSDEKHNQFAWLVRKNNKEAIRPWNWQDVVDVDETAKRFIDRMRNHCTYLLSEETLPKNSLLLNYFNVLNELNKIKLDGIFFQKEIKKKIINDLFRKKTVVKEKDLRKWLIDNQYVNNDDFTLTGFQSDGAFASSLKMEIKFREIFGNDFENKYNDIEKIIEYLTVYNNKEIIRRRIKNENLCNDDDRIEKIMSINISGYSRFSKKLINELVSNDLNTKQLTILGHLEEDDDSPNFMQVLNNKKYGFTNQIAEINGDSEDSLNHSYIEKLPGSPALKRGIWQTTRVVKDIIKYMGHEPNNIYIEFAREDGDKTRTKSRYISLKKTYEKNFKEDKELINELKDNEEKLDEERILLYFMQHGKCLYSGKKLELDNLSLYQVDHIIPRSYTKNDSLDNKALVFSSENQRKFDDLLLDRSIIENQYNWWKKLLSCGLISEKKFKNLTRQSISEKEIENFVARDLVETRQICVHVKNLLKRYYKDTKVSVVYASLSSEFRKKYDLYKIRNLNNCHHANDAFLAATIGLFIDKHLPYLNSQNAIQYKDIKKSIAERKNEYRLKNGRVDNYSLVTYLFDKTNEYDDNTGEINWEGSKFISYIRNAFDYKDYFYNYESYIYDGMLFKATLYKASSRDAKINIKNNMPASKYGGYNELKTSFIVMFEYEKNKKKIIDFEKIPVIAMNSDLDSYLIKQGYVNAKVLRRINIGQTYIEDGSLYKFVSSEECAPIQQVFLSYNIKKILYIVNKSKQLDLIDENDINDAIANIVKQTYESRPKYRKELIKMFDIREDINNDVLLVLNTMDRDGKLKLINDLLKPLCMGKRADDVKVGTIKASYGRETGKIHHDKIKLVYTSPSGLYKTIKQL